MTRMRAKLRVSFVESYPKDGEKNGERVTMNAVGPTGSYPDDGSDEDNTYARWSPSASFEIYIQNPALFGKFSTDQKFYVDFTEADQ